VKKARPTKHINRRTPSTYKSRNLEIKGRVQRFTMQVVINKCFLLNPEQNLEQTRLVVFEEKHNNRTL